ncbi:MAG: metallophosphoesterase [Dermatophilaceae bacterium]
MAEPHLDRTGDEAILEAYAVDSPPSGPGMSRRARMIFLGVLTLICFLLYGVGAWGLFPSQAGWPDWLAWGGRLVAGLAAVTLVVTMLRAHTGEESDGAARIAHVLLGVGWILFVWTMITDLVLRLPLLVAGIENPVRSRLVAVVLAAVVLGLALWGFAEARRIPRVRRVDIEIRGLSAEADGMTIAVLTDTHFDSFKKPSWSAGVVDVVNGLGADVVVHAGDLADGSVAARREQSAALGGVRAAYRFYIAGNHEYYSGVGDWTAHMADLGWEVLLNAHGVVGERLVIAGVDDPTGNGVPGHGTDLDAALAGVPDLPIVLLAHQPHLIATSRDRVDLQISGHTHGGQMWPFHYLVRLRERSCKGCRDTGIAPRCGPVGARATGGHPSGSSLRARSRCSPCAARRPPEGHQAASLRRTSWVGVSPRRGADTAPCGGHPPWRSRPRAAPANRRGRAA